LKQHILPSSPLVVPSSIGGRGRDRDDMSIDTRPRRTPAEKKERKECKEARKRREEEELRTRREEEEFKRAAAAQQRER
jgi:hypothetical protein